MTRGEYVDKMELIIKTYENKRRRLRNSYDRSFKRVETANGVLKLNMWYDAQEAAINKWYGKHIRELTEMGWQ